MLRSLVWWISKIPKVASAIGRGSPGRDRENEKTEQGRKIKSQHTWEVRLVWTAEPSKAWPKGAEIGNK